QRFAVASVRVAAAIALVASMLQVVVGHESVKYVAKYQPMKFAAMEGHYATGPADITLMGWVDESTGTVRGPGLAGAGSYLLHGDRSEPVPGLYEGVTADAPPG